MPMCMEACAIPGIIENIIGFLGGPYAENTRRLRATCRAFRQAIKPQPGYQARSAMCAVISRGVIEEVMAAIKESHSARHSKICSEPRCSGIPVFAFAIYHSARAGLGELCEALMLRAYLHVLGNVRIALWYSFDVTCAVFKTFDTIGNFEFFLAFAICGAARGGHDDLLELFLARLNAKASQSREKFHSILCKSLYKAAVGGHARAVWMILDVAQYNRGECYMEILRGFARHGHDELFVAALEKSMARIDIEMFSCLDFKILIANAIHSKNDMIICAILDILATRGKWCDWKDVLEVIAKGKNQDMLNLAIEMMPIELRESD